MARSGSQGSWAWTVLVEALQGKDANYYQASSAESSARRASPGVWPSALSCSGCGC